MSGFLNIYLSVTTWSICCSVVVSSLTVEAPIMCWVLCQSKRNAKNKTRFVFFCFAFPPQEGRRENQVIRHSILWGGRKFYTGCYRSSIGVRVPGVGGLFGEGGTCVECWNQNKVPEKGHLKMEECVSRGTGMDKGVRISKGRGKWRNWVVFKVKVEPSVRKWWPEPHLRRCCRNLFSLNRPNETPVGS